MSIRCVWGVLCGLMIISTIGCSKPENPHSELKNKSKKLGSDKSKTVPKASDKKTAIKSTVVIYQESETGIKPYFTRYIVNQYFMRIDDGKPDTGYVLLDRKKNIIYSVSVENESILVIKFAPITIKKPPNLVSKLISKNVAENLKLEGVPALEHEIRVNGKLCIKNMSVSGVLPNYVAALKQYKAILAGQHASNLFKTPVNMRKNCFMAYNIFEHGLYTAKGLIVRSWNDNGKQSILRDYKKDQKAAAGLFSLPEKYSKFKAGQVP